MFSFILRFGLSACLLTGCASFQEEEEEPIVEEPQVCTEEPIDVSVNVVDKRWCKGSGYALPRASIYLKKDLGVMTKGRIVEALGTLNLNDMDGGVAIDIDVEQFFCDLLERRSSWNCVSELIFTIKVSSPCGEVFYDRRISGMADNDFDKCERNGKSRKALDTALDDALVTLLGDRGFRKAVKRAARPSGT